MKTKVLNAGRWILENLFWAACIVPNVFVGGFAVDAWRHGHLGAGALAIWLSSCVVLAIAHGLLFAAGWPRILERSPPEQEQGSRASNATD